jgi:SAM-dependent methyltransferase
VATGTGDLAIELARRVAPGGEVVGSDFSEEMLARAREKQPQPKWEWANAMDLPYAGDSFDAATVGFGARNFSDLDRGRAEMARVVRPGGVVCLWEPGVRRLRRAHDRVTHTGRRFARRDLVELVTGAGMELVRATGAYSFLVPPAAVKTLLERGETSSDLDRNGDGLHGVLPAVADVERRLLRRVDLRAGLSVVAIGRR